MLEQVRRRLIDHLSPDEDAAGLLERVVSLDATRGVVDGCCFLLLGADGAPRLVAKTARTPAGHAIFRTEYETLRALDARGINSDGPAVPRPLGAWEEDGTLVTLQTALRGRLLKNEPGAALFAPGRFESTFAAVADWYERFLGCFDRDPVTLGPELYAREVSEPVELFLERFRNPAPDRRLLSQRLFDDRRLADLPLPLVPRHGDFCTANMVLQPHGLGVFDWEFDLAPRLPLFDLFFFLSSTRFPHRGLRGESSHFDSFVAVWWGDTPFGRAARALVRQAAGRQRIPQEALEDLFLVALIHVANMKYSALVEAAGQSETRSASAAGRPPAEGGRDAVRAARWALLPRADKDVPFARLEDGRLANLGAVVARGLPDFRDDGSS